MSKIKNISGKKFGRLIAVTSTNKRSGSGVIWSCKCICGNTTEVSSWNLINGSTKSCGCLNHEISVQRGKNSLKDVSGIKINNIEVLKMSTKRSKNGDAYCFALCPNCNKEWEVAVNSLKQHTSTKCRYCSVRISKIGKLLLDKLEKVLKITLVREHKVKDRFFDGYIPELKLLIESDGTYWHSTINAQKNDKYKEQLAQEFGYDLIRVKNDGTTDFDNAISKIKNYIDMKLAENITFGRT